MNKYKVLYVKSGDTFYMSKEEVCDKFSNDLNVHLLSMPCMMQVGINCKETGSIIIKVLV